jgi:hypothetical protein
VFLVLIRESARFSGFWDLIFYVWLAHEANILSSRFHLNSFVSWDIVCFEVEFVAARLFSGLGFIR